MTIASSILLLFLVAAIVLLRILAGHFMDRPVPESYASNTISTPNGLSIFYIHSGDPESPRIIYLHGTPGRCLDWGKYIRNPIEGFESIAIDRPGFGNSSPGAIYSLEQQAAALEPLLVERQGRYPILVGHSLGGPIVARAAADFPDKVGGLVIAAGALDPALEKIHWYQRLAAFPPIRMLLPKPLVTANRELYPLKGELENLEPLLGLIKCPIVVLHGKKDSLVPIANVDYMKAHFPPNDLTIHILKHQDHFLPWTAQSAVREAITEVAGHQ